MIPDATASLLLLDLVLLLDHLAEELLVLRLVGMAAVLVAGTAHTGATRSAHKRDNRRPCTHRRSARRHPSRAKPRTQASRAAHLLLLYGPAASLFFYTTTVFEAGSPVVIGRSNQAATSHTGRSRRYRRRPNWTRCSRRRTFTLIGGPPAPGGGRGGMRRRRRRVQRQPEQVRAG